MKDTTEYLLEQLKDIQNKNQLISSISTTTRDNYWDEVKVVSKITSKSVKFIYAYEIFKISYIDYFERMERGYTPEEKKTITDEQLITAVQILEGKYTYKDYLLGLKTLGRDLIVYDKDRKTIDILNGRLGFVNRLLSITPLAKKSESADKLET